jgi:regulator of sirC expression with transglutaminase-like and TPR domain
MVVSATAYKDEQTIDAATALLMLTPNAAEPYRYRGLAYVRTGNKGQALQDIQRAADLGDSEAQRILQTWK